MDKEEVKEIVREMLKEHLEDRETSTKYTFQKDLHIFNGHNIELGRKNGTRIGTSIEQKLGFFNTAPVSQPTGVEGAGGCSGNADAVVNQIAQRLRDLGLIAS